MQSQQVSIATMLIAPFDGIVAEIEGKLGEYVTPSPVGVATKPTLDLIDKKRLEGADLIITPRGNFTTSMKG